VAPVECGVAAPCGRLGGAIARSVAVTDVTVATCGDSDVVDHLSLDEFEPDVIEPDGILAGGGTVAASSDPL
jgi:hypothetical protein